MMIMFNVDIINENYKQNQIWMRQLCDKHVLKHSLLEIIVNNRGIRKKSIRQVKKNWTLKINLCNLERFVEKTEEARQIT